MSDQEDIDALAGEYVLGTLTGPERRLADARRLTDLTLDQAIQAWERRLTPLIQGTTSVAPPADLFKRIEARLDAAQSAPNLAPISVASNIVQLEARVRRWRWATVAASALAASFAMVAVFRDQVLPPKPLTFVGAFVQDDKLPKFMLTIDLGTRELTIRPVGADRLQGQTYQLWIASDRIGPAPRSLGVLDDGSSGLQRRSLADYDPNLLQTATFGVSIEPVGGSTTGRPSPGALHAKLFPAKP
jgi:anti-sigma-K factor RskA